MFKNDRSDRAVSNRKTTRREFNSEELAAIRERKGKRNKTVRSGKTQWESTKED